MSHSFITSARLKSDPNFIKISQKLSKLPLKPTSLLNHDIKTAFDQCSHSICPHFFCRHNSPRRGLVNSLHRRWDQEVLWEKHFQKGAKTAVFRLRFCLRANETKCPSRCVCPSVLINPHCCSTSSTFCFRCLEWDFYFSVIAWFCYWILLSDLFWSFFCHRSVKPSMR